MGVSVITTYRYNYDTILHAVFALQISRFASNKLIIEAAAASLENDKSVFMRASTQVV